MSTYVQHSWIDQDGDPFCYRCGLTGAQAAPADGPLVSCGCSTEHRADQARARELVSA